MTVENDADENALDVASESVKRVILGKMSLRVMASLVSLQPSNNFYAHNYIMCYLVESIQHEDRAVSNAQALLQSAWLGDAVSVKKSLEVTTCIY